MPNYALCLHSMHYALMPLMTLCPSCPMPLCIHFHSLCQTHFMTTQWYTIVAVNTTIILKMWGRKPFLQQWVCNVRRGFLENERIFVWANLKASKMRAIKHKRKWRRVTSKTQSGVEWSMWKWRDLKMETYEIRNSDEQVNCLSIGK